MIRFILSDLKRLWAGSLVVVLLVSLATALGVTVTLQERALRLGTARAADKFDLVIGAAGSETQLVLSSVFLQAAPLPLVSGETLASLAKDPRVAWAGPVGFGDSFAGYPIVGTTTSLIANTSSGFVEGQGFADGEDAVIGSAVDLPLGAEIKPMHGAAEEGGHTHTEIVYHVQGRLKPTGTPWDRAILVPISSVWHIHGMDAHENGHEHAAGEHEGHAHDHAEGEENGLDETFTAETPGVPAILVKPKTIADAYKLRQQYRQGNTLAVFPGEVLTKLYATLGDAREVLSVVAIGAQSLVAASLILVTLTHIVQRRKQIGALRAFGAPRSSISLIVWTELFALFATGIGLGFAIGFAAAKIITGLLVAKSGVVMPVEFAKADITQAVLLLAVAAGLAILPAWLAYRQSPAEALRG
ncbi:FtsX-like permease family protein [Agrobacterium rosae]|uniref:ABC transporter permease n=1 Tax=Agrobacterium rosae TaxID=1972867 RepID=A0AAE5VRA4_9HYPH|nr:FtsX-like permease family protein [Agrobacterium rosae]KAA3511121.1 ABC transporter permease [Agrobacterium rosae]KAA3518159.1 ABC transporter permease [Agrobacterium rosae]MCM2434467.1 FtsX-like permease family protein [Agrobacterium rosae]MDX8329265.1 FtsX-like permease family protein [Agrobacterium rosae]MQB49749.1 ABC transporter permease [Agrobacterium rosae]